MLFSLRKYVEFYFTAKTKYGIHSPFLFDFIEQVYEPQTNYYSFSAIEYVRNKLKKNHQLINVKDFGAGSKRKTFSGQRKISEIATHSLQQPKMSALLFRLINFYSLKPIVIELGTSLGICTAYLSTANKKNKIYTIEGCDETAEVAKGVFKQLGLKNIELIVGNFDSILPNLKFSDSPGFVYIDGNHRKEATLKYFDWAIEKLNEQSIVVVDDIYWSKEMFAAWEKIKFNDRVTLSIDLYKLGIVFFHKVKVKEHYKIRKSIF